MYAYAVNIFLHAPGRLNIQQTRIPFAAAAKALLIYQESLVRCRMIPPHHDACALWDNDKRKEAGQTHSLGDSTRSTERV
jgi:hypothetical protein